MVYLISYDLNKPGQSYANLYQSIKNLGSWCHPLDSTWFVVSELSATAIRDQLRLVIDQSDSLIVNEVGDQAAWYGLSQEVSDWLKSHI